MALILPSFLDAVAVVGEPDQDATRWFASGFFYGRYLWPAEDEGQSMYAIYFVTNRHVLAGRESVLIRANPLAEDAEPREFALDDLPQSLLTHPDQTIDVAAVKVNFDFLLQQGMQVGWFRSKVHAMRLDEMKSRGACEGDGVFVLGFPMGLVGAQRAAAIVRAGNIARLRDTLARTASTFLIDASVYPGNSGGPVVYRPEPIAIKGTESITESRLIGVVRSYVPYIDVAVSPQTQRPRVTFEENSGLAECHPVDHIDETIDTDPHGAWTLPRDEVEPETLGEESDVAEESEQ